MASNQGWNPARSFLQPSFAGGELSPSLQGRVDLARYAIALKTCRNFVVMPYGGVSNRPGFRYVGACKYSDRTVRLIPFSFNTEQTYIIELGHQYARFHRDGITIEDGGSPVEVVTPYDESDLFMIKYVQSADVLTLVHNDYPPQQLKRYSETDWYLDEFVPELGPFQDQNVDESVTVTSSGTIGSSVVITASSPIFSAEHVGTLIEVKQMSNGDVAAWMNRSSVSVGDLAYVDERVYEAVELSDTAANTLTGDETPAHEEGEQWDGPKTTVQGIDETLGVKWKYRNGAKGVARIHTLISSTKVEVEVLKRFPFTIINDGTYRWSLQAWNDVTGYPGTASYYQQRLVLANSRAQPQTFWMSETGIFTGFDTNTPIEADDGITFTLASRQVNEIRHLVPLGSLLALTSGAEWLISDNDQGLAPDTIKAEVQGYRGASDIPPLLIGSSALYIQARDTIVRDLAYSFEMDGFTGDDLTIFSSHLFQGYSIKDWAYAQEPGSVVWVVRNDGTMLSMTYQREQQVVAWAHHDTVDGEFESVAVISEGSRDVPYAVVKRRVNGGIVRYIEYLDARRFDKVEGFFCVDSGLTYNGRSDGGVEFTLSGGSEWTTRETLTLTSSEEIFSPAMEGRRIRLYVGEEFCDVDVTAYVNIERLSVTPVRLVPDAIRGAITSDWALMATKISGLDHLEGEAVSILADGNVHAQEVVTGGSVTLDYPVAIAHIGLPITADIETLPISSAGETVRDTVKSIVGVGLQVDKSRGVFVGRSREDFESDSDNLIELKQRDGEMWAEPTGLMTGLTYISIPTSWDQDGRVFVRQSDPLPLTILSIIPRIQTGGKG